HQENCENDRHDGHDRTGDAREDRLSDLGILMCWKKDLGNPGVESWDIFLGERQDRAGHPEDQSDKKRADEKSPAQAIQGRTKEQRKAFAHDRRLAGEIPESLASRVAANRGWDQSFSATAQENRQATGSTVEQSNNASLSAVGQRYASH